MKAGEKVTEVVTMVVVALVTVMVVIMRIVLIVVELDFLSKNLFQWCHINTLHLATYIGSKLNVTSLLYKHISQVKSF